MKKRMLALVLTAALVVTLVGGVLPASALWVRTELTMGDVSGDGKVNTTDARMVLQYAAEMTELTDAQIELADVNAKDEVSTTDARLILQHAANLLPEFPCGKVYRAGYSEAETTPNENPEEFADYTSGNPIFSSIFTADPSAHVWNDGRIYVYPSRDIFPAQGCDLMNKYRVFSSDNMVDWVDEGQIMEAADVMWSNCDGFMWAPDCCYIEETDTYYYFFPHPLTDDQLVVGKNDNGSDRTDRGWNYTWVIGVAKSVGSPTGPFEQLGYVKLDESLVTEDQLAAASPVAEDGGRRLSQNLGWFNSSALAGLAARDGKTLGDHGVSGAAVGGYSLIDPCAFVDDDGTVYLYYGGGSNCFVVKLGEDMLTATTVPKKIMGLTDFHEGAWVFKYPENGFYYALYADNHNEGNGNRMRYAISRTPEGPFNAGGVVLEPTGCDTSHGSIAMYKGNWYLFYHNQKISGVGNLRSVCVDQLYFDENGLIQTVKQTTSGVAAVGPASTATEDKYSPTGIDTSRYTVTTEYTVKDNAVYGGGATSANDGTIVQNMHVGGSYCEFTGIDGGKGGKALVTLNYAAQGNSTCKVNASGDTTGEGYFLRLDSTGSWSLYQATGYCVVDLKAGSDNVIRFNGGSGFNLKGITVSLLPENAE